MEQLIRKLDPFQVPIAFNAKAPNIKIKRVKVTAKAAQAVLNPSQIAKPAFVKMVLILLREFVKPVPKDNIVKVEKNTLAPQENIIPMREKLTPLIVKAAQTTNTVTKAGKAAVNHVHLVQNPINTVEVVFVVMASIIRRVVAKSAPKETFAEPVLQ